MRYQRLLAWAFLGGGAFVACNPSEAPSNPDGTATFDIELVDDQLQTVAFGHNILSTEHDQLFLGGPNGELVLTPFIGLAPEFFFNPVGVTARFRSPFANTQVIPGLDINNCPTTPGADGCSYVSDAELELFTRDPSELYNTLLNDSPTGLDFLTDISTPRMFPTGEATTLINPSPFALPDVVVMDVTAPPITQGFFKGFHAYHNQPSLAPVVSTSFWLPDNTADPNNLLGPAPATNLWGSPASLPLGLGSIKGVRLVQHAPCEFETPLQGQLDNVKEQLVNVLNGCNQTVSSSGGSATVNNLAIRSFNSIPAITRVPSAAGFGTFQTQYGLLVHGDMELSAAISIFGVPVATAPCEVDFLYEYRPTIVNGLIQVVSVPHYFNLSGGGQGSVNDIRNVCHYIDVALRGDANGNGLGGFPPVLTNVVTGTITSALSAAQFLDTATLAGAIGLPTAAVKCHAAGVGGAGSCKAVATALSAPTGLVVNGATKMGLTLSQQDLQLLTDTLNLGAATPDGTGNWSCNTGNDDCTLKLPVDAIIGQPDVIGVQPFESFTEFDNPSLLLFFLLVSFDSPVFPVSRVCNRIPVTLPAHENSYERLYATSNIRNLTCASHDPALLITPCSKNSDCSGQASVCVGGNCDVPFTTTCASTADCMPWEACIQNTGKLRCMPIGPCNPADPFAPTTCPTTFDANNKQVQTYCFNIVNVGAQCRRP